MSPTSVATATTGSQEQLVTAHLPFVRTVAQSIHRRLPPWIDLESLIQSGVVGLLDAAARYDDTRGVTFQNYARHRIQGEIFEYLRSLDWMSRSTRAWQRRVAAVRNRSRERLHREASAEEMANALGLSLERYYRLDQQVSPTRCLSLEEFSNPQGWEEQVEPSTLHPFSDPSLAAERKSLKKKLLAVLETLSERERLVIHLYYREERTLKEIGEQLGLTEARVCQIHGRIIALLQRELIDDRNLNFAMN
jgi:RNA polymerase sigma factor FliA